MDARGFWTLPGVLLAAGLLVSCASSPNDPPGESGVRTLARAEVDGLLLGKGMGMAAAAEINGYPGPAHVLELKNELGLTADQRFATSRLVGLVQGQSRALGQRIVSAEKRLDEVMAEGDASGSEVRGHIQAIASLRAQLRFAHMNAHLEQKKILTPEQVRRYYELRGREVVLPPPALPAAPAAPLVLPAGEATPEAAAEKIPADAPVKPALETPLPADIAQPATAPLESTPPAVPAAIATPAAGEKTGQQSEAATEEVTLTPGMRDAMEDAEAAPSGLTVPSESGATETPVIDEPAGDAASPTPDAQDTTASAPEASTQKAAPMPGKQDAMEDAKAPPLPVDQSMHDGPALPLQPLEEPGAPDVAQPRALSAGAQDAIELATPANEPTQETIYIAPLEELPPVESEEPATVNLDN